MRVKVVPSRKKSEEFQVELNQGVQYFRLDYSAPKEECQWMAKMFRKALRDHDKRMVSGFYRILQRNGIICNVESDCKRN
jgi:hypothetical protein